MKNLIRKIVTVIKNSILIFIFVFLLLFFNRVFSFLTIDDSNELTRLTLHELYNQKSNIDMLFLGSSHCMRTFDPNLGDQLLQENTFNAGTSAQFLDGSFALLKEAEKTNQIKEVWVELYYGQLGRYNKDRTELTSTYIISDYMKTSCNKIDYLLGASTPDYYANSFIPARRNWHNLFMQGFLAQLFIHKTSESYKNYLYIDSYGGKGFITSNYAVPKGTYSYLNNFWPVSKLTSDDDKYLSAMILYAKKHNIKIHFFSAPMSDFRLVSLGNYDDYVNEIKTYLEKHNCDYYDLNLCKPEYLKLDESDFIDDNHLNTIGANSVTQLLCKIIKKDVDYDQVFYKTYAQKISNQENINYGIQLIPNKTGDVTSFTIKNVSHGTFKLKYYIGNIVDGSSNETVIQEQSDNNIFSISNKKGTLHIIAYDEAGNVLNEARQIYAYE